MAGKLRYIAALALIVTGLTAFSQNTQKKKETIDYIDKYKDIAMTEMVKYKVPASIPLAQGILESGNGQSKLAKKGNNHFGIKCHSDWKGKTMRQDDDAPNECFRVYDDPEDSYRDHSEFLRKGTRYAFLFDLSITDYKAWAKGLKKAGYATLPTYANVLINLIETYDLQQYDELVVKGKFKPHKKKETTTQEVKKDEKPAKPAKRRRKNAVVLPAPVLENCRVVSMTPNHHYIRENFGVKFIITKEGDNLDVLSKDLKISKKQLVKYNNLGSQGTFAEGEVLYINPKRHKAPSGYSVHVVKQGENLRQVSRLYAVKLERLYKMNGLNENSVLQVGQEIRLR